MRDFHLLAIDPGKMSGLSYVHVHDDVSDLEVRLIGEFGFDGLVNQVDEILTQHDPYDPITVVMERYTISMHTVRLSAQPDALYTIGAVRGLMVSHNRHPDHITLQAPSAAKAIATNAMLRDTGLWAVGLQGHANDAGRHVLLYLLTHGWVPKNLIDALQK